MNELFLEHTDDFGLSFAELEGEELEEVAQYDDLFTSFEDLMEEE